MARIKFGAIITEGHGSLGGFTAQDSFGGAQLRTKPINKKSPSLKQSLIRSYNGVLQGGWRNLTDAQRLIWNHYAEDYDKRQKNGDQINLSGHSLYMSLNYYYVSAGYPPQLYPSLSKSLVLWYRMDGDVLDYSGNGNNGTPFNLTPYPQGVFRSAYSFNGSTSYVATPIVNLLSGAFNFTLACFVKYVGNSYALVQLRTLSPVASNLFFIHHAGSKLFWFRTIMLGDMSSLISGQWNHLAMVYNSSSRTYSGYLNGVSVGVSAVVGASGAGSPLYVGGLPGVTPTMFSGQVDEVTLFNRMLTAPEVLNLSKGFLPLN